jgi:hypothetical protein
MAAWGIGASGVGEDWTVPTLDGAVERAARYVEGKVDSGTKVSVVNIEADAPYHPISVINTLSAKLVNQGKVMVIEWQNRDVLQDVIRFQQSGAVSDETAAELGQILGVDSIIIGSITPQGRKDRLHIRVIDVETAELQGAEDFDVRVKRPPPPPEAYKRYFASTRLGFGVHPYETGDSNVYGSAEDAGMSFDFAFQAGVNIFPNFSVQTEVAVTSDEATQGEKAYTFKSTSMQIPLLLGLTTRPGTFVLSAFGGPYVSVPLSVEASASPGGGTNALFGLVGGLKGGMNLGPGVLFVDYRYWKDLEDTTLRIPNTTTVYRRSMHAFSLGYEMSFIDIH